jgi:hypothetical protein
MNRLGMLPLSTAVLICLGSLCTARADETLKFRLVMHVTAAQTQEVGDVDGHVLGVGRYSGLATFPDGSVGTANITFGNDSIKGDGTFFSYFNLTLKDGSALWWKGTGLAKPEGKTTIFPEFPVSVLSGTGRFEGAKGDGTQAGVRLTPLSAGADLYADVVINVKK